MSWVKIQSIRRFLKVLLNLSMGTCRRRFSSNIFPSLNHRSFSAKSKSRIASVLRGNTVYCSCAWLQPRRRRRKRENKEINKNLKSKTKFWTCSTLLVDFSLPRHVSQRHRMHDYTVILKIFTLRSIYSTNASGAEQTPETNNSNRIIQDIAFLGK